MRAGDYDVVIAGGGNAAMCAAIEAREAGCRVLVAEHAPQAMRAGNSRHTRNLRTAHVAPTDVMTDAYLDDEFWDDLLRVTGGETDEKLARQVIAGTHGAPAWMTARGVRFQPSLTGTLSLSRTNLFFFGGGKALMNSYYAYARKIGVDIRYDAEVTELRLASDRVESVALTVNGSPYELSPGAVVAATGGFQANIDWLREHWGAAADNFIIRGTPFAQGRLLRNLLDQDVAPAGSPTQFHAVALDARAPRFDGGIATRLDCVPFGIVVNREAERFYDEGEDFWPKRYAIWGRLIAQQPDQIAYGIVDAKASPLFMPSVFPAVEAPSIRDLAVKLGLEPTALERTIAQYNAAVRPGAFDPALLDGCATVGLEPPKSHWARTIEQAPFSAYPLRPGITFTYLGVQVDADARVRSRSAGPLANLFAAGEIMTGNILGKGYLAGFGMSIGTVFGRIAGQEAARHALN